jgi:hypothetical protein
MGFRILVLLMVLFGCTIGCINCANDVFLGSDKLTAGSSIKQEILICSQNNNFCVKQGDEGQILVLDQNIRGKAFIVRPVVAKQAGCTEPFTLTMKNNGNLVMTDNTNQVCFNSGTLLNKPVLMIRNSGDVVIQDANGVVAWSNGDIGTKNIGCIDKLTKIFARNGGIASPANPVLDCNNDFIKIMTNPGNQGGGGFIALGSNPGDSVSSHTSSSNNGDSSLSSSTINIILSCSIIGGLLIGIVMGIGVAALYVKRTTIQNKMNPTSTVPPLQC